MIWFYRKVGILMSQRLMQILIFSLVIIAFSFQDVLAQVSDNQLLLDARRAQVANPTPSVRDFKEINSKHEILVAVIDTGVDYNHPTLLPNIHFSLDSQNQPQGLGWDFTANDSWPAPLLARSIDLDKSAPSEVLLASADLQKTLADFVTQYPQFKNMINPDRQVFQELTGGLFHGTHVAGLMVYDEPKLGLLAYRALPFNLGYNRGQENILPDQQSNVILAIQRAIKDGARVINLSLGIAFNDSDEAQDPDYYASQQEAMKSIKKIAKENPQVAFVAASGNKGNWIDDKSRFGLPCGVEAKNILCVGALSKTGEVASFSNIVLPDYPFLLAPGDQISSLFPTQFCPIPSMYAYGLKEVNFAPIAKKNFFFKTLADFCSKAGQLYTTSGTSMASPIAARMVAKTLLANPKLSGAAAIQKVLDEADSGNIGRLSVRRLRVEKPSWYPASEVLPLQRAFLFDAFDTTGSANQAEPEYFEFYTK